MLYALAMGFLLFAPPQAPTPAVPAPAVPAPAVVEQEPPKKRDFEFEPGVMVWLRGQARHNQDFTEAGPDAIDAMSRLRIQALMRWRGLSGFVQVQDHRQWGSRNEPNASGALGFQQGWFEAA